MQKLIRIIIADDERLSLKELNDILDQIPGVQVIAMCANGEETLKNIMMLKPDMIMLDINMPGIDGIMLGRMLNEMTEKPYLIFVTAYQEYAVQALNLGARGYVLKPFSTKDIEEVVERAKQSLSGTVDGTAQTSSQSSKVATYDGDKILFFNQLDIGMAVAKNRHVYLVVDGNEHECRFSLSELEKKLDAAVFFRTHRNYIVNLNKISNMVPWFNNTYMLNVVSGDKSFEAPLSRDKIKVFKVKMSI
jgi:DNA-binding LytR/AlgR family response regulator